MLGLVRPIHAPARARGGREWAGTGRDAWTDMEQLRREMDDFVTRAFGFTPLGQLVGQAPAAGQPPMDLLETQESFVVRAYLPGLAREDIRLEVTENGIALWGDRRPQAAAEGTKLHWSTVPYGRFQWACELPAEIRTDGVEAAYRDGVLEVTLPKVQASRPTPVKVPIQG